MVIFNYKIQVEVITGFGLAITWYATDQHDFAIILLSFAIKFKQIK